MGRTIGIVGAGRIGQAVARRARAFGMQVLYNARTRKGDFEQATRAARVDLVTLLGQSDVVSLHAPELPETRPRLRPRRLEAVEIRRDQPPRAVWG